MSVGRFITCLCLTPGVRDRGIIDKNASMVLKGVQRRHLMMGDGILILYLLFWDYFDVT